MEIKIRNEMNKIILSILIVFVIASCEEKIIDLVVKINNTFEYSADNNGSFTDAYTATRSEILENFDYDVSGIQDVNISYLELAIMENSTNQASRMRVTGTYSDNSTAPIVVFENFELNIADFLGTPTAVSGYQAVGIEALANKLRDYLNGADATSFTIEVTGVAIDAAGNPVSEDINLQMEITLDAEVVFEEEATLPSFP